MLSMVCCMSARAADHDSLNHIGFALHLMPGKVVKMDSWQRLWQKKTATTSIAAEVTYTPQPADSSAFARDYGYPTFAYGLKLSLNDVTMHRSPHPAWGLAEEVDYDSRLGNIVTAYGTFTRPWLRSGRWTFDYMLGAGIGWGKHKYSKGNNIDNELTGSRFLIYFTAGTHAVFRVADHWGLKAGVEFYHHSNGALNRPNKGANVIGPMAGLVYQSGRKSTSSLSLREGSLDSFGNESNVVKSKGIYSRKNAEESGLFGSVSMGVGGKTLNEDWQLTQFRTPPDSARYRTGRFRFYTAYSAQADLMYRYARRWASGIGADLFYGTYADRVKELEGQGGAKVSPWSVGVAVKHNAYYGRLSVNMSLGYYLYRHMGTNAKTIEKPYYERIGVFYAFPRLGGLSVGASVKAHLTKADLTEVVVSYPIRSRR